jgi:hypothetical protein
MEDLKMETIYQERRRHRGPIVLKYIGFGIMGAIGITVFSFLFGYFVMLLWNWLMPMLFKLPLITFWQAVGIIILARLLFGSWKHSAHPKTPHEHYSRARCGSNRKDWNKWKFYGQYWKEEGENQFNEYVKNKEGGESGNQA